MSNDFDELSWVFFYHIIQNDIKCKADVIIAIAHWLLVDRTNLKCLGVGDEVTILKL